MKLWKCGTFSDVPKVLEGCPYPPPKLLETDAGLETYRGATGEIGTLRHVELVRVYACCQIDPPLALNSNGANGSQLF